MRFLLNITFILVSFLSYSQNRYIIKVKNPNNPVNNSTNANFNFNVDNSNNDTYLKFRINGYAVYKMTVSWGDGSPNENFSGKVEYTPEHRYTTAGLYNIICTVNDNSLIKWINIGNDFSPKCNVSAFSNLQIFYNLTSLVISGASLKLWNYSSGFSPTVRSLWFTYNQLNSNELNKLLIYLNTNIFYEGTKQLYIYSQTTGVGPTAEGLTALASLESKGWIIYK